jgi:hypothetical protein
LVIYVCLYNCGPRWKKESMPPEMLRQALEAMAIWPQRPQVHLTGGEPFLHFDLLLEGTHIAAELGITVYLETSAAWCTDEEKAVEHFRALKEAGLQAVLISCSPFHAERIPAIRTILAARAAIDVFGAHRTIVYQSQFLDLMRQFDVEHPTPLSRYEEVFGTEEAHRILWQGFGIISGGRSGYALEHLAPKHPAEAFAHESCAGTLLYARHSHFDLYGNYLPGFCGGLTVGDWRELGQVLDDFQAERYPPLIKVLIERGPYGLMRLAREEHGYAPCEEGYTGKCHLCVDVRRHLIETGDFEELHPQGFYENF